MGQLDSGQRHGTKIDLFTKSIKYRRVLFEVFRLHHFAYVGNGYFDLACTKIGDRRYLFHSNFLLGKALNIGEQPLLFWLSQGDGHALTTGTTELVSRTYDGLASGNCGPYGGMSADGRFVSMSCDGNEMLAPARPT